MPASAAVGTPGSAGTRLLLRTASARSFPSLMFEMADGSAVKAIGVCPPIVELTAGVALFMGFSKIAIALGSAPDDMPTIVVPTPDLP